MRLIGWSAMRESTSRKYASATLSPFPAALTDPVKHNPFVCHSYRKHPGWGSRPSSQIFSFRNPIICHSLLSTIPFTIRTYEKTHP